MVSTSRRTIFGLISILWPINRNDRSPPHTVLTAPPSDPSPADVVVELESIDDETPSQFMRHYIEIDGVLEETLRSGTTVVIAGLSGGLHDIQLRAVDLNDNVDSSPVQIMILVDDIAPVVSITESPLGIVDSDRATLRFVAIDDRSAESALEARYTLAAIDPAGGNDIPLVSGALGAQRELVLDKLPEDTIVRVRIFAADEAGNAGSADAVFAINTNPTRGCAAGGPTPIGLGPVLILVAGVLLRRCRRRRP